MRHRDIWDLRWLKQEGAKINHAWINHKINDYRIEDYAKKLNKMWKQLPEIINGKAFKDEIGRFIPMDVQERTLKKEKFYDFLINEIQKMLSEVQTGLN